MEHSRACRQFTGRPGYVLPGGCNLVEASQALRDLFRSDRAGAKDAQGEPVRSRTVDSRPTAVGPLSRIRSIRPSRSARTCSARVGESRFDRLALGAASGWPARSIRPRATGGSGTRSATVSRPAVTMSGIRLTGGARASAGPARTCRRGAPRLSGQSAVHCRAWAIPATWTISGLNAGRPLAAKIRATAAGRWRRRPGRRRSRSRRRRALLGTTRRLRPPGHLRRAAGDRPGSRGSSPGGRDLSIELLSRRGVGRFFTPGLVVGSEPFVVADAAVVEPAERPRRVPGQGVGGQERQGDGRVGVAGDTESGRLSGSTLPQVIASLAVAPERPPVSGRASVTWRK